MNDPETFDFELRERPGGIDVRLRGELDMGAVFRLEPALDDLAAHASSREVVFDLRELTFIDSSGLGVLVAADRRVRSAGGETRFVRGPDQVMRVFARTALDTALPFEPG
jgi:anti-anti-sigma factor